MGSRLVANGLASLGKRPDLGPVAAEVVLLAPEIDVDLIRVQADDIFRVAERLTVYANRSDVALTLAELIHGYPRAGQAGDRLRNIPVIDIIDSSTVDPSFIGAGHSYHFETRAIITDLSDLVRLRTPPSERSNLRRRTRDGFTYWEVIP